eukprot:848732-Prorocentrum_minimum.AAC.1
MGSDGVCPLFPPWCRGALFAAFSAPFWVAGYGLAKDTRKMFLEDTLEIGPNSFTLGNGAETKEGYTADLS